MVPSYQHARSPSATHRTFIVCLCAGHFLAFVDRFLASAALSSIKATLSLGDGALGVLIGPAFALAYCCGGLVYVVFGLSSDPRTIKRGILLWTAGECICAVASSGSVFAAGQMAIGVGQAIFIPSALQAVMLDRSRIGERVSLFTASSTLGRSIAVLCAGMLLSLLARMSLSEEFAWRLLYLLAAIANITLILFIPPSSPPARTADDVPNAFTMRWLARDGRHALWIMGVTLPAIVLIQAVAAWMPTLFARGFGYPGGKAATYVGIVTLLTAPTAQLAWGRAFDRWRWLSRRPHAAVAAFTIAAALTVALLAAARSQAYMLSAFGLANIFLAAASLFGLTALQLYVPANRRAAVSALFLVLVTTLGAGLGPFFVGILSQAAHSTSAGLASALGMTALGTAGVALLIAAAHAITAIRAGRPPMEVVP